MTARSWWQWIGQRIGLTQRFGKFWTTYYGARTYAGEPVTLDRALTIGAYWRAIRLNAEAMGSLPRNLYRTDVDADPIRDLNNQYDVLLRVSPNEDQTPAEFWESMVGAEMSTGNGYARKVRVGKRIVALEVLDPLQTCPYRNSQNVLRYRGVNFYGENFKDLAPEDVFHMKGFNFGGDEGLSTIRYGAQSMGMTLAGYKTAAKMMGNGLSTSGFLETAVIHNPDDRERLQKIMDEYAGSDNAGKLMILEGGMKYNRLSLSPVDAQLLQTIGFGIEEIGRWTGTPTILLGHNADGQTQWGSGVEAIITAWYVLGLRSRIVRTEQAITKRLFDPEDRAKFYPKFNVAGFLRGDSVTQSEVYSTLVNNGLRNRNEIRRLDDLKAIPGGDEYTVQVNLTTLQKLAAGDVPAGSTVDNAITNVVLRILDERARRDRRDDPQRIAA